MRNSSMNLQFSSLPTRLAVLQSSAVSSNTSSESLRSTFSRERGTGSSHSASSSNNNSFVMNGGNNSAAMSSFMNGLYNKASNTNSSNGIIINNCANILQFPRRVHQILDLAEAEGNEHIISWMGDGRAFRVHDRERFGTVIMPRFFKQTSFRSFERQCLLWGFKIITSGPNAGSYFHPKFIRGQPELCQFMVREKLQNEASMSAHSNQDLMIRQRQASLGQFGMQIEPSQPNNNASNLFSIMQQRLIQEKILQSSQNQQRERMSFQQGVSFGPSNDGIDQQQQQQFDQQEMLSSIFNNGNNNFNSMINKSNFSMDNSPNSVNLFMTQLPTNLPRSIMPNQITSPDFMTVANLPVNFSNQPNQVPRSQSLPFPWKLHDMLTELSQQGHHQIVSWNESGTAFKIHNPKKFESSIMLQYFRQTKFKSFQRQLNLWGFERVSKGPEKGSYRSPHFIRSDKSRCRNMTHTSIKGTSLRSPVSTVVTTSKEDEYIYNSPEEFIDAIEDQDIRQDVQALHNLIRRVAPKLPVPDRINKNLLEYGKYSHQYKTGKVGEWCKVGISYGKQITLHCSGLVNNKYVIGHFADQFPRAKAGITSLRFSRLSDLSMRSLESLIHATAGADLSTETTLKAASAAAKTGSPVESFSQDSSGF